MSEFSERTTSNNTTNHTLASLKIQNPEKINDFKLNLYSEGTFDGKITKEDSLRASKNSNKIDRILNQSTQQKNNSFNQMVKEYSETPKPSNNSIGNHFSYNMHFKEKQSMEDSKSIGSQNSPKNLTLRQKLKMQNKNSQRYLKIPENFSRGNSQKSKRNDSGNHLLPIRRNSKRILRKRQNSKWKSRFCFVSLFLF
jgi:hypothetical protein